MKTILTSLAALAIATGSLQTAMASGWSVNVNVAPPAPYYCAPQRVYRTAPVVVAAPPVYYAAPAPVLVYPQPVYVAPAPIVVRPYGPVCVAPPILNFGFGFGGGYHHHRRW